VILACIVLIQIKGVTDGRADTSTKHYMLSRVKICSKLFV